MGNFSSPDKVRRVIEAMRTADEPRAFNRARINELFNGFPPFTDSQVKAQHIDTNVNYLEGPNIAHGGRSQLYNGLMSQSVFFQVTVDVGPPHLKSGWGRILTKEINRCMKNSLEYLEACRATHAQVILHGIGPRQFEDRSHWCADSKAIEDVLVPSGTLLNMRNMEHYVTARRYTATELYKQTHGKQVDPGWNVGLAEKIVGQIAKEDVMATGGDNWQMPERLVEDIKSNAGYYSSDAVPTLNCWDFYCQADDAKGWYRKVIVDSYAPTNASGGAVPSLLGNSKEKFLYDSGKRVVTKDLQEILHVQFADCSSVAPFRWHSVRSLGYLLYNVCHLQNRLRCRFADAQFMELLWFFRNVPEEDRERLLNVQLYHMGVIPQGVDFVTGPERYHPDANLIALGLSQNRQLMAENSASFVQDVAKGMERTDETATLTMAKVNNSSALIGSMLNLMYDYERPHYLEVCRRFATSSHPDCVKVRKRCMEQGVPKEAWNIESWDVEPERVIGGGNRMLEVAQLDRLMAVINRFDPEAQRIVLHLYTLANTNDPKKADLLVPMTDEGQSGVSRSEHEANLAMGTLMLGLPVPVPRNVAIVDYTETLLVQLKLLTESIEQSGGMTDMEMLRGLVNVAQTLKPLIAHIAQDQNEKQRVKQMNDVLGQAESFIKAFAQRLMEQQEAQQMDPEAMAKVQAIMAQAQAKMQAAEATTGQKLRHKEIAFKQKTQQSAIKGQMAVATKVAQTQAEIGSGQARTAAELQEKGADMEAEQAKHTHQILMDQEAHEAELQRKSEQAAADKKAKANQNPIKK